MFIRVKWIILCLAVVPALTTFARPVSWPSLQEMWEQADLVVVIRPIATTNASDQLTSAGPKYGPRDPKDYQAMNTRCEVVLAMKSSPGVEPGSTKSLTLLHFRYAPNVMPNNGAMFIHFDFPVEKGKGYPEGRRYLAFLKRRPDARFEPVTGNYDSEPSFRIMETPIGGHWKYIREDAQRSEQRANEQGGANGRQPFSSETNQPSAPAASRRSPSRSP